MPTFLSVRLSRASIDSKRILHTMCASPLTGVDRKEWYKLTHPLSKISGYATEPGDLRLGQVVIKSVAVVKLGVNSGSGDGGSCFGIEVWTDTAKLTNMVTARLGDR